MSNPAPIATFLTAAQAAEFLNIDIETLRRWRKTGDGPKYTKYGDGPKAPVRYPRTELEAFALANLRGSTSEKRAA